MCPHQIIYKNQKLLTKAPTESSKWMFKPEWRCTASWKISGSVALHQHEIQKHQQSSSNSYQIQPPPIISKNVQTWKTLHCITQKSTSINQNHETLATLHCINNKSKIINKNQEESSKRMFKPEKRCTASTNNQKTSTDIIKKLSSVIRHQRKFPPKLFQLKKRWLQKNSAKNLLGRSSTCLAGKLHQNIMHWICMIPHRTIRGFPMNHQKKCLNLWTLRCIKR